MKLIKSSVWHIPQEPGLLGVYKQIELAGRTAYKSEDKITEDSAKRFVDMLIERKHYRPLEFGTIYLTVPTNIDPEFINFYDRNHWSTINFDDEWYYITTNARVIIENKRQDDLKYISEPYFHDLRFTVKVICSRGIMDEARTHIALSHLGESTRYCNYSKNKFDNQVTFVMPHWVDIEPGNYSQTYYSLLDDKNYIWKLNDDKTQHEILTFGKDIDYKYHTLLKSLADAEYNYFHLLNGEGLPPQDARAVLPLQTKSELMMCGYLDDWNHFITMRCAVDAHPDMQIIANKIKETLCL